MSICRACRDGDHRHHQQAFGGICVGCACGHLPPPSFFAQSDAASTEATCATHTEARIAAAVAAERERLIDLLRPEFPDAIAALRARGAK